MGAVEVVGTPWLGEVPSQAVATESQVTGVLEFTTKVCGAAKTEVTGLVAGPVGRICGQCVRFSAEVIASLSG